MRDKLLAISEEHDRLSREMATPEVAASPHAYRRHAKALAQIDELVSCFHHYQLSEL